MLESEMAELGLGKYIEAPRAVIQAGGRKFPNPSGRVKERMVNYKCDNNIAVG